MQLQFIPLISAMLPAIAVHLCYLLAAHFGHVPWCFPYIDSCASISAAGRENPENYIFRASIIPTAVLMMVYWKLSYEWFKTLKSKMTICNRAMLYCGVIACFGLILYTTTLGSIGEVYNVQRRIGVTLFYVLTFLAQLIMTSQIAFVVKAGRSVISRRIYQGLLAICLAILTLGIISILLPVFYKDHQSVQDSFEWVLTLLILMHFFVTYFAWKDSGFKATFAVSN
jgi:hypothetical protein